MYIKEEVTETTVIEKSRFIAYVKHCTSEEEYREYLASIRKKHYDASHVCSAFVSENIKRSSDDGEPSGTAGVPILNVLEKNNLSDVCALVVRYFGGIKLGAGGLIRAYGTSVNNALNNAVIVEEALYPKYSLKLNYETANKVRHYIENNTYLLDIAYDEEVNYIFALDDVNKIERINEFTKGISPKEIGIEKVEKVVK